MKHRLEIAGWAFACGVFLGVAVSVREWLPFFIALIYALFALVALFVEDEPE